VVVRDDNKFLEAHRGASNSLTDSH
jgi:hypothetical protein